MQPTQAGQAWRRQHPTSFTLRGVHAMGVNGEFAERTAVRVRDGWIAGLDPSLDSDPAAPDIDLSGAWLMPGVVDTHLHAVTHSFDGWEQLSTPYSFRVAETLAALRATLLAGVTLVRDAGGLDAGIRDAVAAGLAAGPELQVSVVPLSRTGGHGDGFLAGAGLELSTDGMLPEYLGRPPHLADGPDEVRRVVRTILRSGADWIKIMATGGVLSSGDGDFPSEFSEAELEMAIGEATMRGKPVMVHALGGRSIGVAVRAGARSIEHGVHLTEADAELMAEHGVTLVPTLGIYAHLAEQAELPGALAPTARSRALAVGDRLGDAVRIAKAAGVRIALGTDFAHRDMHGRNLFEITALTGAGLSLPEALVAATANGADLCGVGSRTGRLLPGFRFDAVLMDSEPAAALFGDPDFITGVFQAGCPVRAHPGWTAAWPTHQARTFAPPPDAAPPMPPAEFATAASSTTAFEDSPEKS